MLIRPEPYRIDNRLVGARFDFTRSTRPIDPRITFTRASNASYFDSTGTLQTAGSGVARAHAFQDHNPSTLAPLGFLIEEQRTNSIRNAAFQGAGVSTEPDNMALIVTGSGVSTDITSVGTENGISYVDVAFSGTSSVTGTVFALSFDTATAIVATSGQVWSGSLFVKLVSGSVGNATLNIRLDERTAAGAGVTSQTAGAIAPTGAALSSQRAAAVFAATNALTERVRLQLRVAGVTGTTYNFTLRIGLPQLELGAFATSPILTSGAAATRLADSASITGTNFSSWFNPVEGTIVVSADTQRVYAGANQFPRIVSANDGTANNAIRLTYGVLAAYTDYRPGIRVAGVTEADFAAVSNSAANNGTYALAYKLNDSAAVRDGGTVATDGAVTMPVVTQLTIGNETGSAADALNGHIQSLVVYRKRLSNQTLQTLTA